MLLALKRVPGETESSFAATGRDVGPLRSTRRSWRSSSSTRRFKAAISERWVVEDFLREEVSRRISLRETREISSFKTDATFDMTYVWGKKGEHLRTPHVGHEFLPSKFFAMSEQRLRSIRRDSGPKSDPLQPGLELKKRTSADSAMRP